ncbi:MAG: pyruvate, phosphate dikinase [Nitrospirae bacterium]|nr:pyruvate, phosphate dikinase [Nitrospirota bacterium]
MAKKYVYFFGNGKADGNAGMKSLLGGKGANLAEMAGHPELRLPVPLGFTITTEVCTYYYQHKRTYPPALKKEVESALKKIEGIMKNKFGDLENPLLVSVRSGARSSMPGMMETVLNVGLTEKTIPGLIKLTNNPRFVYDAYRRLIMMYSDVVMEKAAGIETKDDMGIRRQLDRLLEEAKHKKGVKNDTDLDADDLRELCDKFKQKVKDVLGKNFPDDPYEQLWGGIGAVFASWNGKRAVAYRRIEGIPGDWGTAVSVQSMVFGNMGDDSATGVGFTRNPANGNKHFYGEYLPNAQGEDVVAGIRTPAPVNESSKNAHNKHMTSLEKSMPKLYKALLNYQKRLERHYKNMQDIEFTIERGKLYMLQCRVGKRNGPAAVKMALDMYKEKLITKEEAIMRVTPSQLEELLYPVIDPKAVAGENPIAMGIPAGPGAASGRVVFSANDAVKLAKEGIKIILVREETNPEDVEGMRVSEAILTAKGGMTSHAALVARGWGKCAVVGAGELQIDYAKKRCRVGDQTIIQGEEITIGTGEVITIGNVITVDGTKGVVYKGQLPMIDPSEENETLNSFLKLCDPFRRLKVRTNADTPEDAKKARSFGAEGIGLFRTEHMFYGKGAEVPLFLLRKMIVSRTTDERRSALNELYLYMKSDIKGTLEAMEGFPVTIRLLDPPLHEFVPHEKAQMENLAASLNISMDDLERRAQGLRESNPMMGHRGVRLGITYPEITETQARAIFEAAAELIKAGKKVHPEIMIPVVSDVKELANQFEIVKKVYNETLAKYKLKKFPYMAGTMIEIPRAALLAGKIAEIAEFFSFGTNDLTQMGFGFSRDDIGGFLPCYLEKGILPEDPFQTIDIEGIGEMIKIAVERGRKTKKNLKIGICGEHGGDPMSVEFCHNIGMDYVSCSPYRVPIARLAAAQAMIREKEKAKSKAKKGKR